MICLSEFNLSSEYSCQELASQ